MPPKNKPSTRGKGQASEPTSDSECETNGVTQQQLEIILAKHFEQQTLELKEEIGRLSLELTQTRELAEQNQRDVERLTSENIALKDQLQAVRVNNIRPIEELIEARTNRMLRKTLVFKNIPETANESWNETESALAQAIHEVSEVPLEEAASFIERAHRAAPVEQIEGPRPIFCAFYDWKKSELVKETFKRDNIDNRGKLYAEQKFGPLTSKRRNEALKVRKELKASNRIISGYLAYPAKLMVRTEAGAKYHVYKDFSQMHVTFKTK